MDAKSRILLFLALALLGGMVSLPAGDSAAFYHKKKMGLPSKEKVMEEKAAKGGPGEKFSLGAAYEKGKGVEKNKEKAIEWYYKAGLGFLKNGNKDKAGAALAAINRLSPGHRLGIRLAQKMK